MLSVLFSCFQVVHTAVCALILQTFQMWLQTARRQLYYLVTEARHGFYWRRVHVSARRTTVWTLLYLAIAKLTPLKLQDAFFADDFFALIAHLSVVELEFMADQAVIYLVFYAELRKEFLLPLFFRLISTTLRRRLP